MLGTSWQDDNRKLLTYRVRNLYIGDVASFQGVVIKRDSRLSYMLRLRGRTYRVSGTTLPQAQDKAIARVCQMCSRKRGSDGDGMRLRVLSRQTLACTGNPKRDRLRCLRKRHDDYSGVALYGHRRNRFGFLTGWL